MPAKKLRCGWCDEVIKAKPWAYYRPPGEKVFIYVMTGPRRIYDWEKDKWY